MLYGLYQSATGADFQALKMETVSNNLANAGTSSFKRDLAVFAVRQQQAEWEGRMEKVPAGLRGHAGNPMIVETFTDFTQGPLKSTGGNLDVALLGQGFFQVSDGDQNFLTRNGSFALNANSELVLSDTGLSVLDVEGNPMVLPPGSEIQINERGVLFTLFPGTQVQVPVGQIAVVNVENPRGLQKLGNNLYATPGDVTAVDPEVRVRQGFLEQSGVQPVKEMLTMIETSRAFEANMNMIQHQEHTLGQLLQAVGGK